MINQPQIPRLRKQPYSQTYAPQSIKFALNPIQKTYVALYYTLLAQLFPQILVNEPLFTDQAFKSRVRGKQTRSRKITTQKNIVSFLEEFQKLKKRSVSQTAGKFIKNLPELITLTKQYLLPDNIPGIYQLQSQPQARSSSQTQKQLEQQRKRMKTQLEQQQKIKKAVAERIRKQYQTFAQEVQQPLVQQKKLLLASQRRKKYRQELMNNVRRQALALRDRLRVQPQIQQPITFYSNNLQKMNNAIEKRAILSKQQLTALNDFIGSWNVFQFKQHQITQDKIINTSKGPTLITQYFGGINVSQTSLILNTYMFLRQQQQVNLFVPQNSITTYFKQNQVTPFRQSGTAYFQYTNPLNLEYYAFQSENGDNLPVGSVIYKTFQLCWCAYQYLVYPVKFYFFLRFNFVRENQDHQMLHTYLDDYRQIMTKTKLCQNVFFQILFHAPTISSTKIYTEKLQLLVNLQQLFLNCQVQLETSRNLNQIKYYLDKYWFTQFIPFAYTRIGTHFANWLENHPKYVIQQDQMNFLQVENIFVRTWGLPLKSVFGNAFQGLPTQRFFEQFMQKTTIPILTFKKVAQKLNWQIYSKHSQFLKMSNNYQLTPIPQHCLHHTNRILVQKGFPEIILTPTVTTIKQLSDYCNAHLLNLKILGLPQISILNNYHQIWLLLSPGHLDISFQNKLPRNRNPNIIVSYKNQVVRQRIRQLMIASPRHQIKLQDWILGKQLPLDQSINRQSQIQLRSRVLVIDIQALSVKQQRQVPYLLCAVGYLEINAPIFYRAWSNTQTSYYDHQSQFHSPLQQGRMDIQSCIQNFVDWLSVISSNYSRTKPLVIWGYNMMGYQISYILLELTKKFGKVQMQGAPNQCKCFSVCQRSIVFADIMLIINTQSLKKNCDNYKIVIKKQQFDIGNFSEWQLIQQNYSDIKKYCYYDCISSLLLLHKVQTSYIQIANSLDILLPWNTIALRYTSSSIGFWFFIHGFFKRSMATSQQNDIQQPTKFINQQPNDVYIKQRNGYYGGVVQVFKYHYKGNLFVVDINSMYPAMLKRPLPWHYLEQLTINSKKQLETILKQKQSNIYFFEVVSYSLPYSFKGTFIPTKQSSSNKNTYFGSYSRYICPNPCFLHGLAIKRILKLGGSITVDKVHKYSGQNQQSLKQFATTFYNKRKSAQNPSIKSCLKLIMNSLIGRFSMSQKSSFKTTLIPKQDNFKMLTNNIFLDQSQPVLPAVGRMVRLTSMVTQYSRVYLDELAQRAGYQNVCYCDTDSLIVSQQGYINLGQPKTTAQQLGDFKCQGTGGDNVYYSEGFFFSRKNYLLQYQKEGLRKYLFKSKGIPKKFITDQFIEQVKNNFINKLPQILNHNFNAIISLNIQVDMQVWRKSFKQRGGVTIRKMLKQVNVIVDRIMISPNQTGYPHRICELIEINDHLHF